jgi:hypothetical protein
MTKKYIIITIFLMLSGCNANYSKMNKLLEEEKSSNDYNYFLHEYKNLAEIGYEPAKIRYSEINSFINEIENQKKMTEIDVKINKLLNENKKDSDFSFYLNEYRKLAESGYAPAQHKYNVIKQILEKNKIQNNLHIMGAKLDKFMEIAKERPLTSNEKSQIEEISNNSDFVNEYQSNGASLVKKILDNSYEKEDSLKKEKAAKEDTLKTERATEEKKRREDEMKQAFLKRKSSLNVDIVSQVLNYTSGCEPEGCSDSTWFAYDASNCIYRKASVNKEDSQVSLNKIDPRGIKMEEEGVYYDGRLLFGGRDWWWHYIDQERMLRGWKLIYSDYCSGKKRAF